MIRFQQQDPGLNRIAQVVGRSKYPKLPDTLYVFGANENRESLVYISPEIPNAKEIAMFLSVQLGGGVSVEPIGNPPQRQWIAFNRKLRDGNYMTCSRICLFVERAIHNLIIW